jgi:hypothetical protein
MPKVGTSQSGQILIVIILVMVVSLTVGLSVISRSITNIRTSSEEASSAKALAAAEAGVQKALQECSGRPDCTVVPDTGFADQTEFSAVLKNESSNSILLNGGLLVPQSEGVDLWLMNHKQDGTLDLTSERWPPGGGTGDLKIYWGESQDGCSDPALEILVIRGTGTPLNPTTITSKRFAVDPCDSRQLSNNFVKLNSNWSADSLGRLENNSSFSISGKNPKFILTINTSNAIMARIIPIYKSANFIAVQGPTGVTIPSQGANIESRGTSSNVERKLNVFRGYNSPPIEFFSGLTVPSSPNE